MNKLTIALIAAAGTLVMTVTMVGGFLLVREFRDARIAAREAAERERELEARIDELERRPPSAGNDGLGGLLDGLFGDGGLDGLLGGFGDIPGARCLTPGGMGDLGGLLDGLLGGDAGGLEDLLGDLDGLEDLFGGGLPGDAATLPTDPDELVAAVAGHVEEMRELSFREPVAVDFLDDAAITARLRELVDEGYSDEDAVLEGRILSALGAVPHGTDMKSLRMTIYEEQVAGFYDSDTSELVVRSSDRITPADRVTLAHELVHALTDQAIGLPDLDDDRYRTDGDLALATLAVVEGDAVLVMNRWALERLSFADQMAMATDPAIANAQASLAALPPYLASELLFPYEDGLEHICDLWLSDGWAGIDKAYIEPPSTTAQVLWSDHPGRTDSPAELRAPAGFQQDHTTTLGAAPLLWLLEAPGGDGSRALDRPEDRAQAWGGGQLTLWSSGDDVAVGVALVDRGTGPDLCTTVTDWYGAAFPDSRSGRSSGATTFTGGPQSAAIVCDGADVRIGIGPDTATATRIVTG